MNEPTVKSTRGRTKGSFSFATTTLGALQAQLGANANVIISRKWAEAIGLQIEVAAKNSIETMKQTSIPAATESIPPLTAEVED